MQKNRKKTKKAIGNSNNQNNQTKEVKGIVAHVESLNDLISLLPLPPSHQSESEVNISFGEKCEEQNNEVSIIVSDDDDTNEKSSLIEQISELQLANETLEKEKRVLIEQMEVHKTEELKKNASIEELQQIVSTLRSRNEFLERPLPGRIHMIKKHQKKVAELNQKIDSQAKENEKVVSTLRSENEILELSIYKKDELMKTQEKEIAELYSTINLLAIEKKQVILSIQKEHEEEINYLNRRNEELVNEFSYCYWRCVQEDIGVLQKEEKEKKSLIRWLLSGIWSGFSDLCWKFKNHFMKQRLRWKIVYMVSLFIVIRFASFPNRKPDYCRGCYILMR